VGKDEPSGGWPDPVAKVLGLPFAARDFAEKVVIGGINEAGRRTLYLLIATWDLAEGGPFAASAIGSAGLAKTVDIVETTLSGPLLNPVLKRLGADHVKLRAALCASQLVGLGIMRYAVRTEPLHSMDINELVDAVAPTIQRYLTGDLSE
jgi:hypothetical protein